MKQETIEEAAEKYSDRTEEYVLKCRISKESISHLGLYLGFIEGAKWQQDQISSIIEQYLETAFISKEKGYMNIVNWYEQFKREKKCYHPMTERKHTSDFHFECTVCGYNNY